MRVTISMKGPSQGVIPRSAATRNLSFSQLPSEEIPRFAGNDSPKHFFNQLLERTQRCANGAAGAIVNSGPKLYAPNPKWISGGQSQWHLFDGFQF
jgi:hypothetical protein